MVHGIRTTTSQVSQQVFEKRCFFVRVYRERRGLVWRSMVEYVYCLPQSNHGMRNDTQRIGVGLRKVFVQSSFIDCFDSSDDVFLVTIGAASWHLYMCWI